MNKKTSLQSCLTIYNLYLNENPVQAWTICNQVLTNTKNTLTTEQTQQWTDRKTIVEQKIAEKRKTAPNYAQNIIINEISIDQRSISTPTANYSIYTKILNHTDWIQCRQLLRENKIKEASNLFKSSILANFKDLNNPLPENPTSEQMFRNLLCNHITNISACYEMIFSGNASTATNDMQVIVTALNNLLSSINTDIKIPKNDISLFQEFYAQEMDDWKWITNKINEVNKQNAEKNKASQTIIKTQSTDITDDPIWIECRKLLLQGNSNDAKKLCESKLKYLAELNEPNEPQSSNSTHKEHPWTYLHNCICSIEAYFKLIENGELHQAHMYSIGNQQAILKHLKSIGNAYTLKKDKLLLQKICNQELRNWQHILDITNDPIWIQCRKLLFQGKPQPASNLCSSQIQKLENLKEKSDESTQQHINTKLSQWIRLSDHIDAIEICLKRITSTYLAKANEFLQEEKTIINSTTILSKQSFLQTIYQQEKSDWDSFSTIIDDLEFQMIKKFLYAAPLWYDYFSKPAISDLFKFIDPDCYPDLHKIALEGHINIESNTKKQFLYAITFSLILSLSIFIELWINATPIIAFSITLFITLINLMLSSLYVITKHHFATQIVFQQMRNHFISID